MDKDTEYDIINGIDLFDFIYKFDSKNENLDKYNMSFNKNNNTNDDNYESYISYFDMDGYIENIKKSYSCREDKIYYQFNLDYPRQNTMLNGYKYDKDSFIKNLDKLLINVNPDKIFDMTWRSFIILLCCQSSFSLPFLILQKKYISNSTNKILVSGGQGSININININNEKVIIELNSICNLKEMEYGIKTEKIKSSVTIELNKNRENELYDPLICVFSWKIYPL
jgi:hypothetical protein